MKQLSIFVLSFILGAGVYAQKGFTINGRVQGVSQGKLYYSYTLDQKNIRDSVAVKDGAFAITGSVPGALLYFLRVEGVRGGFSVFVENAPITVTTDTTFSDVIVTGSACHQVFREYADIWRFIHKKAGPVNKRLQETYKKDSAAYELAARDMRAIGEEGDSLYALMVAKYASSPVAPWVIIDRFVNYPNPKRVAQLYPLLKPAALNSSYGKQLTNLRTMAARTAIGAAPAFTQPDVNGKQVSLKAYKGKYVLVDFWASWCAPCRKENPFLLAAYNKYHEKGFDVLGVSLDDKKDRWINAIAADSLPWKQVSDLKGWQNDLALQYGIRSIPMNFLVDREGKIIAKDLRGKALEEKLKELLP